MRRRQIYQLRAAGVLPPVIAFEREAWERERVTVDAPVQSDPGTCSKCGRKIGRGVKFHERVCVGGDVK